MRMIPSWRNSSCRGVAWRSRIAIVLVGVLASACDQPLKPDSASRYQLLFVNAEKAAKGQDIFRMSPDGSGRENLTQLSVIPYATFDLAVTYRSMALAPDGRTIAFESNREGCPGIWGMNVDGSGLRKLSIGLYQDTRCNYYPIWSPDGRWIAFTTSREGRWSVYVMDADGGNPRNVSAPVDREPGFNWPATWSPDGRVVFQHPEEDGEIETYTVMPDGTDLRLLFDRAGDHSPDWSPDGSKVAFIRDMDGESSLFVMKADGSDLRRLTARPGKVGILQDGFQNANSRWSPDGRVLVYTTHVGTQHELRVINADGTGDVQLTNYLADFSGWAPDGRITFTSDASGSHDVYLINRDGTGLVNLTSTPASDEMRAMWVER